ncbi:MAG: hypothetical protein FJX92_03350 [Bacteroidetes bacterium]|nr:hypothetical protein [Bacteroidota bacterium]
MLINLWSYQPGRSLSETEQALHSFSFEDNRITRLYVGLELTSPTAADSQALLELIQSYCQSARCKDCSLAKCWIQDQIPQST